MAVESYLFSYTQQQKKRKNIVIIVSTFAAVLIFLQILLLFVFRPLRISSTSMQPEFSKNDFVFIAPLVNGSTLFSNETSLERGNLVTVDNNTVPEKTTFQSTIDFIFRILTFQQYQPNESTKWGDTEVYRIIGMPGDTIYIDNYVAYIRQGGDSHFLTEFELSDKDYDVLSVGYPIDWDVTIGAQGKTSEVSLKRGEYFLLCDNRIVASDSRLFGPVKLENINARVFAQYFPFNSIRAF